MVKKAEEEWVDVNERLPLDHYPAEQRDLIIATVTVYVHFDDPDEPGDNSVGFATYTEKDGWCYIGGTQPHTVWKDRITHWMPLPKAPAKFLAAAAERAVRRKARRLELRGSGE